MKTWTSEPFMLSARVSARYGLFVNTMKENEKKAFDFASDTTKQLITLATGILALTVTFAKDIVGIGNKAPIILLAWTWGIFIASVFLGFVL